MVCLTLMDTHCYPHIDKYQYQIPKAMKSLDTESFLKHYGIDGIDLTNQKWLSANCAITWWSFEGHSLPFYLIFRFI